MDNKKVRISCHGQRHAAGPRHNDRDKLEYEKEKNAHINQTLSKNNFYWTCYKIDNLTFAEVEARFYEKIFRPGIEAQNLRNKKRGQKNRDKTVNDVLHGKKTSPDEFIFQIGDICTQEQWDDRTKEKMKKIIIQAVFSVYKDIRKKAGGIRLLNMALHQDEEGGAHVHARFVYYVKDRYGYYVPQQRKALENAGFKRPDLTKPISRYNNPKITFTNYMRERFWEKVCELVELNKLDIIVSSIRHSDVRKKHLHTREYKCFMERKNEEHKLSEELEKK